MRPNILALPRTILQKLVLFHVTLNVYKYFAAQSTDMQCIISFLNITNRESKRQCRSTDMVVENFARCQTKIIVACMYYWTSCTYKKLCMDWEFGNKQISSITHPLVSGWGRLGFCKLTCHQTGIWLWEHLWSLEGFLMTCPLQTGRASGIEPYILQKNILLP